MRVRETSEYDRSKARIRNELVSKEENEAIIYRVSN